MHVLVVGPTSYVTLIGVTVKGLETLNPKPLSPKPAERELHLAGAGMISANLSPCSSAGGLT